MANSTCILLLSLHLLLIIATAIQVKHAHAPTLQPVNSTAPTAQPNYPSHGFTEGSLQPQECGGRCDVRCSATQYRKPCMFFCQKCCATCRCVPSGTYGNKQTCPCYNNWKTKRGGPKCP
uniref:Snakin 2 n=1 Tax=Allium cepa TaxID=4679 RepID=A0A7D5NK92_ALLCE|nr:snakin 2 [Allium cepa]